MKKKTGKPFSSFRLIHSIYINFLSFVPFDLKNSHEKQFEKNQYKIKDDNGANVYLRFQRIYSDQPGIHSIHYAQGGKLEVDRYGQLSKSLVTICFTPQILRNYKINEDAFEKGNEVEILLDLALHFFTRFTRSYAEVTGQFWVSSPNRKEIVSCSIQIHYFSGEATEIKSPLIAPVHFSGGKGHYISDIQEVDLRNKLKHTKPDQVSQLLLSAKDFQYKEQYELTIIQCSIAFEYFVYNSITPLTSKTKINKWLKKPDCGCHVGIQQLCIKGLKELFNIDFGSRDEFLELSRKVLKIRNKIVHGDRGINVSNKNALDAIGITEKAIGWLKVEFSNVKNITSGSKATR